MSKRIYLAGPMTGLENNGYDAFFRKARQLEEAGWDVVNPAEMDERAGLSPDREFTRFDYMQAARRDLQALLYVDAIYLLHGYEESPGAAWEWARAKELGLEIYFETPLETRP